MPELPVPSLADDVVALRRWRETDIPGAVITIRAEQWDEVIEHLDLVEGEGVLYRRVEIPTSAGPATSYEWLGQAEGMTPLPTGWKESRKPLS